MKPDDWREEIDSHLELSEEWHRAHGDSPEEAQRQAGAKFGRSRLGVLEDMRAVHHLSPWLDSVVQDLAYAARTFRKAPAFALLALAAIAIGVGAATAVFSVVDPLLFRKLPYPKDEQLVSLGFLGPVDNREFNVVSSFFDWRRQQTAFQAITAMRPGSECDLEAGASPRRLTCNPVDSAFLGVFGITPMLGRTLARADDVPGAPTVILISHALWRDAFGADPKIAGRTVTLDEERVRIIGVLPPEFEMPQLGRADILLAARLDGSRPRSQNSSAFLRTFARLREGVSIEQARQKMFPLFEESLRLDVPAELRSEAHLVVRSLRDRQIHDVKLASWMLLGTVLALLAAACANVTNLLLARAAARRRELALRAAIGAGRGRLARQALTESLLLGGAGGLAGCAVAWMLLRMFVRLAGSGMPRLEQAHIDVRVLLFALAASAGSAVLFGIAPALERPSAESLAAWSAGGAPRTLFRRALVAAQVAISLVLLTGAGLFLRSLEKIESLPLGFEPRHVVTASFTLRRERYRSAEVQAAFWQKLEDRLSHLPGAGDFGLADSVPPRGAMGRPYSNIRIHGAPPVAANGGMVLFRWVSPGYFRTMGIPMVAGRVFEEADRTGTGEPPVILSASLARRMFGTGNPVGREIALDGDDRWSPVVGVAGDAKNNGLTEAGDPEYYRLRMHGSPRLGRGGVALYRTAMDPGTLARWIRAEIAALDPALPVTVETLAERVDRFRDQPRFLATLVALFATLALALAAIGLYGVLSFLVAQRTREIGVRMAVGARPRDIAAEIGRHAGVWTAAGLAAGLAASFALARVVRGLLFEVSPFDPVSMAAAVVTLAAIASLAAFVPAARAARVDPLQALRHE